ncbi:MAG: acyltransferase, partial [Parachlamydiaceae bacterium]|nr:acyltransferase [Parachlamydiaceae bacterium]
GFVIAYSIRHYTINLRFMLSFFLKRSIRLDPPYWATLLILLTLSFIATFLKENSAPFPSSYEILVNVFYLPEFLDVSRILPVSWTLSLEIQFYLFFILMVKLLQDINSKFSKENTRLLTLPALSVVFLFMVISILQNTSYGLMPNNPGLFVYKWYSFMIGALICWKMLNIISSNFFWLNLGIISFFALFHEPNAIETCVIAAFLYGMASRDKMHSYLVSPIFQYLGKISYSLYLIHWAIGLKFISFTMNFIDLSKLHSATPYLLIAIALVMTIIAADLFYRVIEQPSLYLSQKISQLKKQEISI